MACAECERLRNEREQLRRVYDQALANFLASAGDDVGRYMTLKTLADEAEIDLDRAEKEILEHSTRHTVTN